ncbi:MAG: GerMN domain-containing protein [Trueperaceae bacterium]
MRTIVLRVVALSVLLLLVLAAVLTLQTMRSLPDTLIYFVTEEESLLRLEAVGRRSSAGSAEERARSAVAELAAGPSESERSRGLSTVVPTETTVRGIRISNGILHLDLAKEFESGGGSASMQGRLYQLFYTLTQPSGIEGVELSVDGNMVVAFGGEGILIDSPWLRSQHPRLPVW